MIHAYLFRRLDGDQERKSRLISIPQSSFRHTVLYALSARVHPEGIPALDHSPTTLR